MSPGLKPILVAGFNVRAEARTYLTSKDKTNDKGNSNCFFVQFLNRFREKDRPLVVAGVVENEMGGRSASVRWILVADFSGSAREP